MQPLLQVGPDDHAIALSEGLVARRERFDALILPRRGLLNAVARRLTGGNRAESEDLVQETLVRAYTHIDNVTSETTVDGWLCTTLRNLYFNLYRKRRNAPRIVTLDVSEDLAPPVAGGRPGSAEGIVLRRFEYRLVLDALADLPAHYRVPVLLADVKELSYQEIAGRLNLPINTVRTRISRGRSLIRRQMSE